MNDNQPKNIKDWILQQNIAYWGSLALTTTPEQRAIAASKMLYEKMNSK